MKVIFLDIDGVLKSDEFLMNNQNKPIDRNNVSILKKVIGKTPDFSTDEIRANKTFSHVNAKEIIDKIS